VFQPEVIQNLNIQPSNEVVELPITYEQCAVSIQVYLKYKDTANVIIFVNHLRLLN